MDTVVRLGANTLLKKEMKVSLTVADFKFQMFNGILYNELSCFLLKLSAYFSKRR